MFWVTFQYGGDEYTAEVEWDQVSEQWLVLEVKDSDGRVVDRRSTDDAAIAAAELKAEQDAFDARYAR